MMDDSKKQPFLEEKELARKHPNGWVYRIDPKYLKSQDVPPEAIVGAWKVDENGEIIGEFIPNSRYDSGFNPVISA